MIDEKSGISIFQKYLTIWVIICMVIGVLIGKFLPQIPDFLNQFEYAKISIPMAILIWLIIYPMMMNDVVNSGSYCCGIMMTSFLSDFDYILLATTVTTLVYHIKMYKITDEALLRHAIKDYIRFYSEERPRDRCHCKTPLEVRQEALASDMPIGYPIPENKRITKYKEKWCA